MSARLRVYKVFISHSFDYQGTHLHLVARLNAANRFKWLDQSVPIHIRYLGLTDAQLKEEIERRILDSDVVIAFTTLAASRSKWIQWEIECAGRLNKPVLGLAARPTDVESRFVRDRADTVIRAWHERVLICTIKRLAKKSGRRVQSKQLTFQFSYSAVTEHTAESAVELFQLQEVLDTPDPTLHQAASSQLPKEILRESLVGEKSGTFVPLAVPVPVHRSRWWHIFRRPHQV